MTSNNNKPLLIDPYGEEEEHLPLRTPSITVDELKLTEDEQAHLADIPVHSTPQYQEEFSTIAWDQEEIRERQNRDEIYRKKGIIGKLRRGCYASQGWWAAFCVGFAAAVFSALIDVAAEWAGDIKQGVCTDAFWLARARCCITSEGGAEHCDNWKSWAELMTMNDDGSAGPFFVNFVWYTVWAVIYSVMATFLVVNLAPYAAGSGMPELKTILGGYTIKRVLGIWTLIVKSATLVLAVGSGLCLGKEGPLLHIAACLANIFARLFSKYNRNEAKRREILSVGCAVGIAVAFGAPVGGVLFSLEEASSYFPPKTLYRSFFGAIIGALFTQLINPRNSGKLALYALSYHMNWHWFEIVPYLLLGVGGGILGALFNELNVTLTKWRRKTIIAKHPILEIMGLAIFTSIVQYWNEYARGSMTDLLANLFNNECSTDESKRVIVEDMYEKLCYLGNYWDVAKLFLAACIKWGLVVITFGAKVPSGLFIPMLAIGAMFGHTVGTITKFVQEAAPNAFIFNECKSGGEGTVCVIPGTYAIIGAAAMLGGATRVTVSLVVIMFEVTGGLEYIVPLMLVLTVAKWVGDAINKGEGIYEMYIDMNSYPHLENKADIEPSLGTARLIMTKKPLLVIFANHNTIKDVKHLLQHSKVYGFPVVESANSELLVGYITRLALAKALIINKNRINDETEFVFTRQIAQHKTRQRTRINMIDISDYLDTCPIQIPEYTPMDRVYDLFKALGLRYCIVSKNSKLTGIITKKDVVKFVRHPQQARQHLEEEETQHDEDDDANYDDRETIKTPTTTNSTNNILASMEDQEERTQSLLEQIKNAK